ncbi:MAG: recombinase family protein, partial [Bacillota bacterium]|nr:recombinase family protein [Bacillota bacterium]
MNSSRQAMCPNESPRAVAYARYSSDNQREESVVAQLRAIREYAARQGVEVVHEYVDEARTATTDDRPEFLRMVEDVAGGRVEVDLIYVHKLDRFARNRYDSAFYKHKLAQRGVRVVSVTEPLDDSPESGILEAMLEAMAEYYSRNLAREVMKGMRETAYKCQHAGGRAPLGYDVDPETRKYTINEEEAQAVRLIFARVLAGWGYGEILAELNSRGYRTKADKPFGKNSIHDILRNEKYAGVYVFNRASSKVAGKRNNHAQKPEDQVIRIPGGVPAIVSLEEWRKVQEMLGERERPRPRNRGESPYILTGKVICGECGSAFTGNSKIGGRGKNRYRLYSCAMRKRTKGCDNPDVRKDVLEAIVLREIEQVFFAEERIDVLIEKLEARARQQEEELAEEQKQVAAALGALAQRMDNLFRLVEGGRLDSPTAVPRLNELGKEKRELEERLREIDARSNLRLTKDAIRTYIEASRKAIQSASDASTLRHLVEAYVEKVVVYKDRTEVVLQVDLGPGADNDGGGGGSRTHVRRGISRNF